MNIVVNVHKHKTHSGKNALSWICSDCHQLLDLTGYFYQSVLPVNGDLEASLQTFVQAVNSGEEDRLFSKYSTAKKLRQSLCNCIQRVVDIEYVKSVERAKAIRDYGIEQLRKEEKSMSKPHRLPV